MHYSISAFKTASFGYLKMAGLEINSRFKHTLKHKFDNE